MRWCWQGGRFQLESSQELTKLIVWLVSEWKSLSEYPSGCDSMIGLLKINQNQIRCIPALSCIQYHSMIHGTVEFYIVPKDRKVASLSWSWFMNLVEEKRFDLLRVSGTPKTHIFAKIHIEIYIMSILHPIYSLMLCPEMVFVGDH
jgi:hypothetical protein